MPINEICVKTVFLGVASSDRGGAAGLLDSLIRCLESVNVDTEKLVGVTTDGESANTGKKGGLWKLLKDHVGRDILTAWCVCHRSDLALESLLAEVPELPIWLSNLLALVNSFRTSPRRTKLLHQEDERCLTFPKHFEVRFAQHTLNLIRAVLHNLKAATKVWEKMVSGEIASDKKECAMARGFMQKWNATSQQLWLTTLMYDLCKIFERLQKIFQKSYLILPDVITARDSSVENLKIMDQMPIPGGKEEDHLRKLQEDSANNEAEQCRRKTGNHFVTAMRRDNKAVRKEVVQSAINFLHERMNIENDGTTNSLKTVLEAKSPKVFITSSRELVSQMFGSQVIEQFVSDVCSSRGKISEVKSVDVEDTGTVYALKLRKMTQASQGIMKKFLASFLTLTPHSMATERVVSHYNNIKSVKRSSLHQETINGVMNISLNGIGTAYYDPRPAVFTFL